MSTHSTVNDSPRPLAERWALGAAAAILLLAAAGLWGLAAASRASQSSPRAKFDATQLKLFHGIGGASAAYADVVYPIDARPDHGSHLSAADVQRLLPGINGLAHELVKNDAFNILDRAARARSLPTQAHEAVFTAGVQGLQAAGPEQNLTRASAATFLGDFGDRRAVKSLMPLLRDPDDLVRMRARLSLKKLGYGGG